MLIRSAMMFLAAYDGPVAHSEPINTGYFLALRGSLAKPFKTLNTGPTAHVAPGYPLLVGLVALVFGAYTRGFDLAVHVLSMAAAAAQYALLPPLARAFFGQARIGVIVGLMAALVPIRLALETRGDFETTYIGLLLALLFLCAARWLRRPEPQLGCTAVYGVAWGLTALVSPTVLPVFAGLCALWLLWHRNMRSVVMVAVAGLGCAVAILPWTYRNYRVLGTAVLIRDNYGLELAVSNHSGVYPLMDDNYIFGQFRHPYNNLAEARQMQQMGEIAYYRYRAAEARRWIVENPGRFAVLTFERFWLFWFTPTSRFTTLQESSPVEQKVRGPGRILGQGHITLYSALKTLLLGAVTLLGVAGCLLLFRRNQRVAWMFAAVLALYPLPYYLVQINSRYRLPIDWTLWLLAGYAGWAGVEAAAGSSQKPAQLIAAFRKPGGGSAKGSTQT